MKRSFLLARTSLILIVLLVTTNLLAQNQNTIPLVGQTDIKHYTVYGEGNHRALLDSVNFGVSIHDNAIINGGAIGSNFFVSLYRSITVNGQVYTGNRMSIGAGNTINGNLVARNDAKVDWNSIYAAGNNQIGITDPSPNGGLILARGNIAVDNTSTVRGPVRTENPYTYTGPEPTIVSGGGSFSSLDMPGMPEMPTPLKFPAAGENNITTGTIEPGVYGTLTLRGDTVRFSEPGTYVFNSITAVGLSTLNFIIDPNTTEGYRIYVHGDVDLGQLQVRINDQLPSGNSFPLASRIYLETHGAGSNTNGVAFRLQDATYSTNWAGTVYAPYGKIVIGSIGGTPSIVHGALWSTMQVVIGTAGFINHEPLVIATTENAIEPYYAPPSGGKVDAVNNKIGAELFSLKTNYDPSLPIEPDNDIFQIEGDKVWIEVIATQGNVESVLAALTSMGMTNFVFNGTGSLVITGLFPIDKLFDINNLTEVDYARPLFEPLTKAGAVMTEGAKTMKADLVAAGFPSIRGGDVKIGVLSDSYDKSSATIQYAPEDVLAAELPSDVQVVLENFIGLKTDEGRAMLQIIHDIAPDAKLAFRTGFISAGDFANGIRQLANSSLPGGKCNVIVDDISYITEPYYKDGVISKAVDEVVANGVTYITSAGNFGSRSFENTFMATSPVTGIIGDPHNFGSSAYQRLNLKAGTYTIVLQWEDIFYSLGGAGNTGAVIDMDIYLVDMAGNLLFGFNRNNIGADPYEVLPFVVNADTEAQLVIVKAGGTAPASLRFKYIIFRGAAEIAGHTGSSTIVGQANAKSAITVGAILYDDPYLITNYPVATLPVGYTHPNVASFSSRGGNIMTGEPAHRKKPDLIAPNGVETTVRLGIYDFDGDNRYNFFGTSASAPHIAAVTGLLIEAKKKFSNVNITPPEIRTLLSSTATSLTGTTDHNTTSGYGLVNADAAMRTFANPTPTLTSLYINNPADLANPLPVPNPAPATFTLVTRGSNISENTVIYLDGVALTTTRIAVDLLSATASPSDPNTARVKLYTPPMSTSALDGGYSNELIGLYNKPLVEVMVNNATRRYGERNPKFSISVTVDGTPLSVVSPALTFTDLNLNLTQSQYSTTATATSPVYVYPITVAAFTPNPDYRYNVIMGSLTVQRLPVTITPHNQAITYGEYLQEVNYNFTFGSSNLDPAATIETSVSTEYKKYVATKALSVLHNFSTASPVLSDVDLMNKSTMASFQSLKNARKFLLNGTDLVPAPADALPNQIHYLIDVAAQSLNNYKSAPNQLTLLNAFTGDPKRGFVSSRAVADGQAITTLPNGQLMTISNGQLLTMSNGQLLTISNEGTYVIHNDEVKSVQSVEISADGVVTYRLTNGQLLTISNGQLMTISNGQLMTITNGQLLTISNGQLLTISNGQLLTISNGGIFIVVNNEIQFVNSVTITAEGVVTYNLSNGLLLTISNGQLMTISNGQLLTISNGQLLTISNGQLLTISNGQLLTISNGEMFIVVNGEIKIVNSVEVSAEGVVTYSLSNGQLLTISNGQLMTISNGQLLTISNGQLLTISNGQLLTISNSQELVVLINGQLLTISNTSGVAANTSNTGAMVIVDEADVTQQGGALGGMIPVNMITGLNVGVQKLIPGTFVNDNFDIRYQFGTVIIHPVPQVTLTSTDPAPLNGNVRIDAAFNNDALNLNWIYTIPADSVNQTIPSGSTIPISISVTNATPAVYPVYLTYENTTGREFKTPTVYAVFYDPSSGFVTGSGWINSPVFQELPYMQVGGKAHFGFVSKYEKGKTIPGGNTQFQFHAGGLNFKSSVYEWLVVSGSRAQYKGKGTINGSGDYGFLLTAVDGHLNSNTSPDQFRIKIWDRASNVVVYDNQNGSGDDAALNDNTRIGGGSIVIHTGKSKSESVPIQEQIESIEAGKLTISAMPNPSNNYFRLMIRSGNTTPVNLKVLDAMGRTIEIRNNVTINSTVQIGDHYNAGVYIVELQQGTDKVIIRLVKTLK